MSKRSYKPEEIVAKLRQVDVLHSQGSTIAGSPPKKWSIRIVMRRRTADGEQETEAGGDCHQATTG